MYRLILFHFDFGLVSGFEYSSNGIFWFGTGITGHVQDPHVDSNKGLQKICNLDIHPYEKIVTTTHRKL